MSIGNNVNDIDNALISERKIEHLQVFDKDSGINRNKRAFDNISLTHRALPNLDLASIDTSTCFLGKKLSFPLLISSMTGGSHELVKSINKNLALAAEACQVALAVGSQRVMFSEKEAIESFTLRKYAPNTVLIGNIGAVQLNYGFTEKQCQQAVDILQADGLYLHLNPLQEAIQPEGDTNFANLNDKIATICSSLNVPILLKEVGSGLSIADIESAILLGIKYFDIAGSGGTSWSRIEYHRRQQANDDLGLVFQDWGISTPEALLEAQKYLYNSTTCSDDITLIASGGLKTGIDIAKSVIMGASVGGLAAPLLKPAMTSVDATIEAIEKLHREFRTAMFLLGVADVKTLTNNHTLIRSINAR